MSTTYWKNLWAAWCEVVDAFTDLTVSQLQRAQRSLTEPLHEEVDHEQARTKLIAYLPDQSEADNILASIRKMPPVLANQRESFISYVEAAQFFIICGAPADVALSLLRSCITAEYLTHGKDWEHRVRIIGRLIATGRITREDHTGLSRQGITLPQADIDARMTPETLAYAIERALPGWIGG